MTSLDDDDSLDNLKHAILTNPLGSAAARDAVDAKAEEFLVACVKLAKLWQLSDDPFLAIRHLAAALLVIREATRGVEKELASRPQTTGTWESFSR